MWSPGSTGASPLRPHQTSLECWTLLDLVSVCTAAKVFVYNLAVFYDTKYAALPNDLFANLALKEAWFRIKKCFVYKIMFL